MNNYPHIWGGLVFPGLPLVFRTLGLPQFAPEKSLGSSSLLFVLSIWVWGHTRRCLGIPLGSALSVLGGAYGMLELAACKATALPAVPYFQLPSVASCPLEF